MSKMNADTLKALNGSITKWKKIVAGIGVDKGADNCPLCKKFINRNCVGCPVFKKTGNEFCGGTPYYDFRYNLANKPLARKHAKRMLAFLVALLPKPVVKKAKRGHCGEEESMNDIDAITVHAFGTTEGARP